MRGVVTHDLRRFAAASRDPLVQEMLSGVDPLTMLDQMRRESTAHGADPDLTRDPSSLLSLLEENRTDAAVEGRFASALRAAVMGVLERAAIPSPDFRLVLLPSLETTAGTRRLAGETVVTINFALILNLLIWWKATMSIYGNGIREPFCTCRDNRDHALSLLRVAQTVDRGDIRPLAGAVLACDCRAVWDRPLSAMTELSELFVLLHEIGHIHNGDLEPSSGAETSRADDAHRREYDADRFAIDTLVAAGAQDSDARLAAAVFLKLLEFVECLPSHEASATHPPARDRFDRMYAPVAATLRAVSPPPVITLLHDLYDHMSDALSDAFPEEFSPRRPPSHCGDARWRRAGGRRLTPA